MLESEGIGSESCTLIPTFIAAVSNEILLKPIKSSLKVAYLHFCKPHEQQRNENWSFRRHGIGLSLRDASMQRLRNGQSEARPRILEREALALRILRVQRVFEMVS